MNEYTFCSDIRYGGQFDTGFTEEQVKNEPMFFNSGPIYALLNGGPITQAFLNIFLHECPDFEQFPEMLVFDSRVHMLMKGWFPCIPGFHHDDVPRGANGQPDYIGRSYFSQHCMGLVNGDVAPTQFAIGPATLTIPEQGIIYKQWHPEVESLIQRGTLEENDALSGRLIYFDADTLHQGTRAVKDGWRWFGRLSWNTDKSNHVTNEIRRQVQVYLEFPMEGW